MPNINEVKFSRARVYSDKLLTCIYSGKVLDCVITGIESEGNAVIADLERLK
jgi:hypothetical protein